MKHILWSGFLGFGLISVLCSAAEPPVLSPTSIPLATQTVTASATAEPSSPEPLVVTAPFTASPSATPSPKQFYAGVFFSYEMFGGDFDGTTLYLTGDSVSILAPRLDSELGYGLYGGILGPKLPEPFGRLDGEVWLERSVQRWFFVDGQDSSVYSALGVDARVQFLKDLPVQPFLVLGLHYFLLELKNAAEAPGFVIGNAAFSGLGLDLGLGASYDLPWGFTVCARVLFRPALTTGGSAFDSALDPSPALSGATLRFGSEYYF